jgi:hypothetical protein
MTTPKMPWYSQLLALTIAGMLRACGRSDNPVGSAGPLSPIHRQTGNEFGLVDDRVLPAAVFDPP